MGFASAFLTRKGDRGGGGWNGKAACKRNFGYRFIRGSMSRNQPGGYRDPATINIEDYANREEEGVLLVQKAGEMLYRLKNPPHWALP